MTRRRPIPAAPELQLCTCGHALRLHGYDEAERCLHPRCACAGFVQGGAQ